MLSSWGDSRTLGISTMYNRQWGLAGPGGLRGLLNGELHAPQQSHLEVMVAGCASCKISSPRSTFQQACRAELEEGWQGASLRGLLLQAASRSPAQVLLAPAAASQHVLLTPALPSAPNL